MRSVLACLVALPALSLAACGNDTGEQPSTGGEWSQQLVKGSPGADAPTGFVADGDDVLVTVLSEEAVLTSHLSSDGGEFEAGTPIEIEGGGYPQLADPVRLDGVWWLVGTGGLVGEGNDETNAFEPRVLRSDDGLAWEAVDVSGIPSPVDLNAVVAADGVLVAVGDKRNEVDSGGPGIEAAAWVSEDGASWTETSLPDVVPRPDYEEYSYVAEVVASGGRLLAAGGLGDDGALWTSDDAGETWSRSPALDDLEQVVGLVADGDTVLASGNGRILLSDDAGRSFRMSEDQPTSDAEAGYARLWAGGGRFFTFTEPSHELDGEAAVCYADLTQCGGGEVSEVGYIHASDEGDTWTVVDTSELDVNDEFVGAAGTSAGAVSFAHVVQGGTEISTWSGGPLPRGRTPDAPRRVDLVQVVEGEQPEVGVRYHAPLYIHCGMDWLYLGDAPWQRTDGGPDVETGAGDAPVDGWPIAGQTIYGFATLGEDGIVRYSIGGEDDQVIATYEQTGAEAPGCD
jgi:hypothetical protein